MGNSSSKVHVTEEPIFDIVDDFLKDRIQSVAKRKEDDNSVQAQQFTTNKYLHDMNEKPSTPRSVASNLFEQTITTPEPIPKLINESSYSTPIEEKKLKLTNKFGLTIQVSNQSSPFVRGNSVNNHNQLSHLQSVRAIAKRHHSRQQNQYIPQDVLSSFIISQQKKLSQNIVVNNLQSDSLPLKSATKSGHSLVLPLNIGSHHSVESPADSFLIKQSSASASKSSARGGPYGRRRAGAGLKIQINDEEDWIQVSDDEAEETMDSPRLRETLSLVAHDRQSYMFTESGTIFVDGFTAGIGKGGILTSVRDLKLPMKERLCVLCRLGQGASSVVYKALDLTDMKLVALKMIPVYERGKRRQMVRELTSLFTMVRQKQAEIRELNRTNRVPALSTSTPVALRISSRPSTRDNTPQPSSFYIPEFSRGARSNSRADRGSGVSQYSGSGESNLGELLEGSSVSGSCLLDGIQPWAHIVDFYDAFSNLEEGGVALMMEYMDGGSLQDLVEAGGCDDERTLASIAQQALLALEFLHSSCNQIHRDLKPGNILIDRVGAVKLSDFGIMRQMEVGDADKDWKERYRDIESQSQGKSGGGGDGACASEDGDETTDGMKRANTFVGTVTYMAPERIDGREYSYPSDVWSLGLALLTLALGKLPFDTNGGFWTILHNVRDVAPPSLPADGKWSESFREFTSMCLRQDPSERSSCTQLLKHPFLQKASTEPESVAGDDRALQELRSVIIAMYQHVVQLEAEASVLLEACRDRTRDDDVMDIFHRIMFAESRPEQGCETHDIEKDKDIDLGATSGESEGPTPSSDSRAAARLGILAGQLHLPVDKVVSMARTIFAELDMDRRASILNFMVTPKAHHGPSSTESSRPFTSVRKDRASAAGQISPLASMIERRC